MAAGMFNVRLGVTALLLLPSLASSEVTHAAIKKPCMPRAMAPAAVRLPSLSISAEPPKPSPLEALRRALEEGGCAAVEHGTALRLVDPAIVRAAYTLLELDLPLGAGRLMSVNGRGLLFCIERHYHEPGFERGPEGWHKGVTVYSTT
jgi:hypothetical protein